MTSITQLSLKYTKSRNDSDFQKIRHHLNYDRLLEELELETHEYKGEEWCSCPLPFGNHTKGDRNPSFSINLQDPNKIGLYNCFACGGGNIFDLVAALKNISYDDAKEFVYKFVTGTEDSFEEDLVFLLDSKEKIEYNNHMPQFEEETLFQYRFVHPWMTEQGFDLETIKHFQLGYDEDRQGILFPHWWQGKLVGWQLRDLTGERKAKYINTPDFPKRNTLFHYDCECVKNSQSVIVVESPKSVVKLWALGFHNAVATFGASINPEQMASLWHFTGSVFLWFDNDPAGGKALTTATKYLRGMVDLWVVPPVDNEKGDPGDLTSSDQVNDYLGRAKSILELEIEKDT